MMVATVRTGRENARRGRASDGRGRRQRPGLSNFGAVLSAPFAGRGAFPCLKGTKEGVGMLVTEEVGHRVEINGAVDEVVAGQFAAGLRQHLLKRHPRVRQPSLERARAGAHFPGGGLKGRALPGQGSLQGTYQMRMQTIVCTFTINQGTDLDRTACMRAW